ncbi:ABC transporter substrate-binding protein [Arthrobacter sp. HY1533]|uniref:ABC transporter substrate-binding protein n=1 Tax=Arthrobacter sp. HY1533 TaxID=2970919 RepID=UPI0022BA0C48|nr:ABC transporter substrate-binding protein [Arthrobacter sp. HY1533]
MTELSRRNFSKTILFTGLSAVMLSAAACSPKDASGGANGGASNKTLTLAVDADYIGFDPAKQQSGGTVVQIWQAVWDTLLKYNPDGEIVPNLAESFEMNDDNTVLTMKLRAGVKFTDGTAVDAAAAKASIEHMKTGGGSDASRVAKLTVEAPDATTLVLTSPEPNGLMPTFMCLSTGIVASTASLTAANRDQMPVGSGPYTLDAAATTTGATYSFVRNPNYWNKDAFPFEKVAFKILLDITARVSALKSGQVNAAPATSQTSAELKGSGLNLVENKVNWAGLFLGDRNGKTIPALGQVKVRQAMNMVFDRAGIIKALFQGNGSVTNQIFNDKSEAFLPDAINQYPFDVEKAKSLMAEAGFGDGFDLTIPSLNGLDYANPIITQQLGLLNIRVTEKKLSGGTAILEILSGKYPVFFFTLESRTALWDIVQALAPDAVWNITKDQDPALTPLINKAQTLKGAEAKANAQAINKFLIDNAWFSPWALPTAFYATDKATAASPVLGSVVPYLFTFTAK